MSVPPPDPGLVTDLVRAFLAEDVGRGDRTTEPTVTADAMGKARIVAREPAVIAGITIAAECFSCMDRNAILEPVSYDGSRVTEGETVAEIHGPLRAILTAERTALNLLARLSGVATFTNRFVTSVRDTPAKILDTRKTTPGLRMVEKYAVRVGGGHNHRAGLYDGILIKDNHLLAAGGIAEAISRVRSAARDASPVEVEVADLDGLREALEAGADLVLLDNMSVDAVRAAVALASGSVVLEVSGGVNLGNVRAYAETGVERISVGALTHSAPSIDVSLELIA